MGGRRDGERIFRENLISKELIVVKKRVERGPEERQMVVVSVVVPPFFAKNHRIISGAAKISDTRLALSFFPNLTTLIGR